jgi:iron complex transport system ATP-binding protein
VLALIGPNGAGKSTLVRAVSGILPTAAGSVRLDGKNLLALPSMQRACQVAVVPQAVTLPPAFTAWETVLLGRTPYLNFLGQVSGADEEIARSALRRVDALGLSGRRVGELSGGEQQRVLLARALAQSTPVMLMDEPTSHLDLQHQVALMELARNLAHEDQLMLLVALHDLNLAARYADTLVLLVDGHPGAAPPMFSPQVPSPAPMGWMWTSSPIPTIQLFRWLYRAGCQSKIAFLSPIQFLLWLHKSGTPGLFRYNQVT